ncbi:flagellar basal body rod C-terminal domain-containing protein [uncultured Helicobacter sp.]|uniref:flagellar basal body rod C-terminal domain-containing protein n=1 Tax=uncultured Helicobacter sp. TaxID=175537 RepID=UPI00261EC040|nr:flagellar basal body rod C-terminal domain-containing protein [uncultured Helicobacter sp.]
MTIGANIGYDAFSVAQSGINANAQQATLETPNVDLTTQISEQIAGQNGVEANAQTIKTADSMLQTLLDIEA